MMNFGMGPGLFEAAFRQSPTGEALVTPDGRFVAVNPTFARLVGKPETEILGLRFQALAHPDGRSEDLARFDRVVSGALENYRLEQRLVRPDGASVWLALRVSGIRNSTGALVGALCQVEDRTDDHETHAALLESEQRYRALAESATDIIATYTPAGVFTYVSPAIEAALGYRPDEVVGRSVDDLVHPEDRRATWTAFRRHAASPDEPSPRIGYRGLGRDGQVVWLEAHPAVIRDRHGVPVLIQDVIRDVSSSKGLEQTLVAARAAAEAAARAKSDFLANMSHEIRTPLTSILGYAALVAENDQLDPETAEQVHRIVRAGEALLVVVNDILDFSRIEAGGVVIKPRPCDVRDVAHEVLGLFSATADAKGIALDLEENGVPDRLLVDGDRLRQILTNLVGNALKFTSQGAVGVRLTYGSGDLVVRVDDTGPGLTPDQCDSLFQRFAQVDGSITRRQGGTGLGLAICKGLAEAMGGDIGVSSKPGRGSSFQVRTPAPACAPVEAPADVQSDLHVLVVDDNAANRDLVQAILKPFGYEVTTAQDGPAAIALAASISFDAILMDMRMPGLSGSQTAQRIKSDDGPCRGVPILAFSAEPAEHCRGPEFVGHVGKPIDVTALIQGLSAAIQTLEDRPGPLEPRATALGADG